MQISGKILCKSTDLEKYIQGWTSIYIDIYTNPFLKFRKNNTYTSPYITTIPRKKPPPLERNPPPCSGRSDNKGGFLSKSAEGRIFLWILDPKSLQKMLFL